MSSVIPLKTEQLSWTALVGLLVIFETAAVILYAPALDGPLFSDDFMYTVANPYVIQASLENIAEILDPVGDPVAIVANYSPTVLLLHMANWWAFGENLVAHHLFNVGLHGVVSLLLVLLFLRSGIPRALAVFGGSFFLLHPANVEAVAWISQLK
ncbi:hypothetical protein N8077_05660, partial [Myxococcota bacterium]|nr:hypothetical protein [Myxococcota bacterium]